MITGEGRDQFKIRPINVLMLSCSEARMFREVGGGSQEVYHLTETKKMQPNYELKAKWFHLQQAVVTAAANKDSEGGAVSVNGDTWTSQNSGQHYRSISTTSNIQHSSYKLYPIPAPAWGIWGLILKSRTLLACLVIHYTPRLLFLVFLKWSAGRACSRRGSTASQASALQKHPHSGSASTRVGMFTEKWSHRKTYSDVELIQTACCWSMSPSLTTPGFVKNSMSKLICSTGATDN